MTEYKREFEAWLASPHLTDEEQAELAAIRDNAEEQELRFGAPMSFGTAGLRAKMGMGIARMNRFTVAQATQGIATLIAAEHGEARGVAIAYDSRNNSALFARTAACVLAANGVKVYLFDDVRPTPELSFAVRDCGCVAGINITASHNPKEYNGYKAYWEDGAQISPEQAKVVSDAIGRIPVLGGARTCSYDQAVADGRITLLGAEEDDRYLSAVLATAIDPDVVASVADELKIVYTPLHGVGYRLVPRALRAIGLRHLYPVEEQMQPDGNFPTVRRPNPEYAEVFELGIRLAEQVGSDLIIATDPDSDRVGVMSRTADGSFATITGNQMGALLLDYVIRARRARGTLPEGAYAVKSIVSTEMANKIAAANGIGFYEVLTGFKFIGGVIKEHEERGEAGRFLCGFEESYGYLFGEYARDKDAVEATMLITEMTAYYRTRGMTLSDALEQLYRTYGTYGERVVDLYFEGLDGIARRRAIMEGLRAALPADIAGVEILRYADYKSGRITDRAGNTVAALNQPESDVLCFYMANGDKIIIRPSGTEPKVKMYFLMSGESRAELEARFALYEPAARALTESER